MVPPEPDNYEAQELDLEEKDALGRMLENRAMTSALQKFFKNNEVLYTRKSRNSLNTVPEDQNSQIKNQALAMQYANMAKAFGQGFENLKKAAQ